MDQQRHGEVALSARLGSLAEIAVPLADCIWQRIHYTQASLEHGHPLHSLLSEVADFIKVLRSIKAHALHLESCLASTPLPRPLSTGPDVIDECIALLNHVRDHLPDFTHEVLQEMAAQVIDYRSRLLYINETSKSLDDIGLQSWLLARHQNPGQGPSYAGDTQNPQQSAPRQPVSFQPTDKASSPPTEQQVSSWLTLLNSSSLNREPDEFFQERRHLQAFRSRYPQFPGAATAWPKYSEAFWLTLKPQVCQLFSTRSFNFVQWVLEYMRQTWPQIFGPRAPPSDHFLDLADAVCGGTVSPLHLAAALGLPKLCNDLLSDKAMKDIFASRFIGTPLYCALVGPNVLLCGSHPSSWKNLLHEYESPAARAATISLLLDAGSDCTFQFDLKEFTVNKASMLGLALWASLKTADYTILPRFLARKAPIDLMFQVVLLDPMMIDAGRQAGPAFARLLTYVLDGAYRLIDDWDEYRGPFSDGIVDTIREVMEECDLDFSQVPGPLRLDFVPDSEFPYFVRRLLSVEDIFTLKRLTKDPRFDPNLVLNDNDCSESILHIAVSTDDYDLVDLLMNHGGDLSARDDRGRTPLMQVESTRMLRTLITDYGDSTTPTDVDGRNIWHLAAATNDCDLLQWLIDNDPKGDENARATSRAGNTPIAEAFLIERRLSTEVKEHPQQKPKSARLMLKKCLALGDPAYLHSSRPLAFSAVAWSDLGLVKSLVKAGVEFNDIDKDGYTALHYLNTSASESLVSLVMELCDGLPTWTDRGLSPAETILKNAKLVRHNGHMVPTAHPSCYGSLSAPAYTRLLTPEVLTQRQFGLDIWESVCAVIMDTHLASTPGGDSLQSLRFLEESFEIAIQCLNAKGALKAHEETTGRAGIYCLSSGISTSYWPSDKLSIIYQVLLFEQAPYIDEFYRSEHALRLMISALKSNHIQLIYTLSEAGLPLLEPQKWLGFGALGQSVVEWTISRGMWHELPLLLQHITPDQLNARRREILRCLWALEPSEAAPVAEGLLISGLDPNTLDPGDEFEGTTASAMLPTAIALNYMDTALTILNNGGDPGVGPGGYNAIMAAVDSRSPAMVSDIIDRVKPSFDWHFVYHSERPKTYNALQYAAFRDADEILRLLLEKTPLRDAIESTTIQNMHTPAHEAASSNSEDCLAVLKEFGASLTLADRSGSTPLHVAVQERRVKAVEYLLKVAPTTAVDGEGLTPLDRALVCGDARILALFRKYGVAE
ncbi:hypothetical protein S40293_01291 [Stachybotrys chartarum IBT 40293]|nr:hypothetical protein S40293_01291 [Stachybotrys chartarum IBT 40293]